MLGTEKLSAGRTWLANQRRATTVFETVLPEGAVKDGNLRAFIDNAESLPPRPKFSQSFLEQDAARVLLAPDTFERLATTETTEPLSQVPPTECVQSRFPTENLYRQLQGGVDAEPVSRLESLKIPSLCDAHPMTPDHQIVFAEIPNVAAVQADSELVSDVKIVSLRTDDSMLTDAALFEDDVVPTGATSPDAEHYADANREDGRPLASDCEGQDQIESLLEKIFERFPLAAPAILLFVGTEQNPHVDETSARVASAIAQRNVGDVLLIDADVEGGRLSRVSGLEGQSGFTECINRNQQWHEKVVSQTGSSFGFMPVGNCDMDRWNAGQLLRNAAAEMKREYQFICVSAGNTHSPHAGLWFDVCDGTYLVVSMTSSNSSYARSAVEELKSRSARLLGCVVTDAA